MPVAQPVVGLEPCKRDVCLRICNILVSGISAKCVYNGFSGAYGETDGAEDLRL